MKRVDWQRPWLAPLRAMAAGLPTDGSVAERLNALGAAPPRFVPAGALPPGGAYEAFIARSGTVPMLDHLHALLEQLAVAPRKALTAHVLLGDPLAWSAGQWAAKPFLPLPVLGIPGWWPANEEPAFYADATVFRRARLKAGSTP